MKEAQGASIDEDREGSRGAAPFYPINPSMPKSHLRHHLHEKVPIDMVKSLLNVHLEKEVRDVVFQSRIKDFVSNKNNVQNLSPMDKSMLRIRNHLPHHCFQSVG